jgi:AraC-like DNA-binding protein
MGKTARGKIEPALRMPGEPPDLGGPSEIGASPTEEGRTLARKNRPGRSALPNPTGGETLSRNTLSFYRDRNLPTFEIKTCCSGLHSTRPHFHRELSVILVERGQSRVETGDLRWIVGPGELLLIAPGVYHSCSPLERERWSFSLIYLRPETGIPAGKVLGDAALLRLRLDRGEARRIQEIFRQLRAPLSSTAKEGLLKELEHRLSRSVEYLRPSGKEDRLPRPELPRPRIREARALLEARPLEPLPLEALASASGVSPSALIRGFRRAYGLPPHQCQILLRLNEARRLLLRGIPPGEAAQRSGFYDQSHFTRLFRQVSGLPPKAYLETAGTTV